MRVLESFSLCIIVLLCIHSVIPAVQYKFTFANDANKSGNTFTSNGAHITLNDSSAYVEIPEITSGPNARSKSGMIQLDASINANFDTHLNFASWIYYVGVVLYINFVNATYQSFFSMFVNLRFDSTTTWEPLWVCFMYSGVSSTNFYSYLYGTSFFEGRYLILNYPTTGWQYFGCHIENTISGTAAVNYHYIKTYDNNGNMQNLPLTGVVTYGTTLLGGCIGCWNINTRALLLSGIIGYIDICDDTTSCKSFPSTRSQFVADQLKLYEHYWDLTKNNGFDGFNVINPCLRNKELGISDLNFVTKPGTPSVYPSQRGWITLSDKSYIYSNPVDFSDSHQISIQFEIFIAAPTFYTVVYPLETWGNSNPMTYIFTERYTVVYQPYLVTYAVVLQPFKWNQVTISLCRREIADQMIVFIFNKVLSPSSATSEVIYSFAYTVSTPSYKLIGSSLNLVVYRSEPAILKNMKFFKWTINYQTLVDSGLYKDSGSDSYNFETNYNSLYYQHFKNNKLVIPDSSNACKNYLGSDSNVCCDLTQKMLETCSDEFERISLFCIDKCGDGIVQLSPQVLQCDDGNTQNGDGCSSVCTIEDKYECEVMTSIHNKSYCRRKCGNGKWVTADSEACDDANNTNGDGCSNTCAIELGFKCINTPNDKSFCYPNCGDKIRDATPYIEECDDGNNSSFDGCSKDCKVEFNFACTPSLSGGDVCKTIYPKPNILSSSFDVNKMQISVLFDLTMLNQTITNEEILVDAYGPNEPYSISWSSSFQNSTFIVTFSTVPVIIGGHNEAIDFEILNVNKFKSSNSIPMQSPVRYVFKYPTPDPNKSAEGTSKGASYTFIFSFLISVGVSIMTGGSMELMWSLANTLQIIFFYGTLNLYFSTDLKTLFTFMRYSNFDNPITDYITGWVIGGINLIKVPMNSNFSDLGFGSANIIANSFLKVMMIFLLLLCGILLAIFFRFCKQSNSKFARFLRKIDLQIRYETMTRIFVEAMLNLSVSSLINICYGKKDDAQDIVSYGVASLVMALVLLVIGYAFIYPFVYHERIITHPDFNERHCFLFLEFKREKLKCLLFYGCFLIHRLVLSIVFVCMNNFTKHQLVLLLYFSSLMLFYCVMLRPFKSHLQNYLTCFNGFVLSVFSVMMFLFLSSANANQITISSYLCIGIIGVFFGVNWIIIFPVTIYLVVKKIKTKCHKKTQQEIENENKIKTIRQIPSSSNTISKSQSSRLSDLSKFKLNEKSFENNDNVIIEKIRPNKMEHRVKEKSFSKIVEEMKRYSPRSKRLHQNKF